jgi:hypothetical protein
MYRQLLIIVLNVCLGLVASQAMAGDFDGSKPLVCATIEAFENNPGGKCEGEPTQGINLPQFLRIDFEKKTIRGVREDGSVLTTPIKFMERVDGKLILNGIQNDVGWSLVISETTGKVTISAAKDQVGFVVFGACTVP